MNAVTAVIVVIRPARDARLGRSAASGAEPTYRYDHLDSVAHLAAARGSRGTHLNQNV